MFSLVALSLLIQATLTYGEWISVTNGGYWGSWGTPQRCPPGTLAKAFSQVVEEPQGSGDDTSVNAILLYCAPKSNTNVEAIISSAEGFWGTSTPVTWCPSGYLVSFALRVETPQGNGDDTAANNIMMQCSDYNVIEGYGNPWGSYGEWSGICRNGICGILTRVESWQGSGDDTALNDVKFECCK